MRIDPEISGVNIVLLGDFNPAIFTPAWFSLTGLLPAHVADSSELEVAHREITKFSADWLGLKVTAERFVVDTSQAPYVRMRDLVVRVFREQLPHTPLRAFGINRQVHFRVGSPAERDRIGRTLAPVEPWGDWSRELGTDGTQGGLASLTMRQVDPMGRSRGGQINVTVEPSVHVGLPMSGVFVHVNDHYAADVADSPAERLIDILDRDFDESLNRSDKVIDHIMSLV